MTKLEYTTSSAIEAKYQDVAAGFHSGVMHCLDFRREQLRNLYFALTDHEAELKQAVKADLHRNPGETEILEYNGILSEIVLAIESMDDWTAEKKLPAIPNDLRFALNKAVLRKTPYGVVLIIGPWNYPLLCSIVPAISAIAAGNTVIMKPSELVPETARVLARVLESALDPRVLQVVQGAIPETTQLLEYKWDKIMLTGSGRVGKIVATAAANKLTPVCLELGGKSPAIITNSANIKLSAKRLAWAKFVNAGQTCIAPDYVLVEKSIAAEFVRELKAVIKRQYADIGATGSESHEYGHIVSDPLFERAQNIVKASLAKEKWQWGVPNKASRFFPPTILYGDVSIEDASMSDELFNPIFPIIEISDVVSKACQIVKTYHDYPLALYVFTNKPEEAEKVLAETRSGSAMVNDAIQFGGSTIIPFGGVGHSGVGRYHGKFGFDEFTHERPVIYQPTWIERLLRARYPPYTSRNLKVLRYLSRPSRVSFGRTGKVKSRSGIFWLISLLVKKVGITIVVLVALSYFS